MSLFSKSSLGFTPPLLFACFGFGCSNAEPSGTSAAGVDGSSSATGTNVGTPTSSGSSSSTTATTSAGTTLTGAGGTSGTVSGVSSTDAGTTTTTAGTGGTGGVQNTRVPGTEGFDCTPSDGSVVNLTLTGLVDGLEAPTGVYGPPGETDRLFVTLQGGRIEIVRGNSLSGTFLDLSDRVNIDNNTYEERGLLGMAFHPAFQQNGKFFVLYTTGNAEDDNLTEILSEFTATGDSAGSEREIARYDQPENNHNGGGMAIGLDGNLYVAIGDGGWSGMTAQADLYGNGQNPGTLLGKLLRYTLEGAPAPGNMPGAAAEVWDIGLRNAWRIASDGCTGDLYIADVGFEDEGEDTSPPTEEVNVEPPLTGHRNYGWPVMEGGICRESGCDTTAYVLPTDSYPTLAPSAIIGGYVYRGSRIPGLRGTYVYADHSQMKFWAFEYVGGVANNGRELTSDIAPPGPPASVVSFGQDSAGEMYVVLWTQAGEPEDEFSPAPVNIGGVYRIDPG